MKGEKLDDAKEAANRFLDFHNDDDKVGLVTFAGDVTVDADLVFMNSTNKVLMQEYIDDMKAAGQTNIYNALIAANTLLVDSPRSNAPLVEVLLTDGKHNTPSELKWADFEVLANETRDKEIIVYTIGLGDDVNNTRLRDYAEITGGRFFASPTSDDLLDIFVEIATLLSFSGTDIVVTEEIPEYLSYNGDASIVPDDDVSSGGERELVWDVGTMAVDDEWEVTFTVDAEEAVETSDGVTHTRVDYTAVDASSVRVDVKPGMIFNDIAVTLLEVKPDEVPQGNFTVFTATVESNGVVPVSFDVEFGIPGSETLNTQSVTLNPGQSKNVSYAWNTTEYEVGSYTIGVLIDGGEEVWEQNRTDNELRTGVEITQPPPEYDNLIGVFIIILILMLLLIGGATATRKQNIYKPSWINV
jgi:hypothetical protein